MTTTSANFPSLPSVTTIDYHTAGEPFRIVADPPVEIPGATVAERRMFAISSPEVDGLRQLLCFEPRGHADMYGGFITEPDDDGAHFGVLFWHKDGFSTACGHGTIALGAWAINSGLVAADPSGITEVVIDVPSGRVTARVHTETGAAENGRAGNGSAGPGGRPRITSVDFINVPSALIEAGIEVETSRGTATVDLAWGGAIYACLEATTVGLAVEAAQVNDLIAIGREVKAALATHPAIVHPTDDRLSGVYGTIVVDRLGTLETGELHQRNVTIFADGQVDRSPCGSGTSARIGVLAATGELRPGQVLVHDSIVDSTFRARVLAEAAPGSDIPWPAVVPIVSATAHKVGTCTFEVDPDDPLVPGFVLR